MLCKKRSYPTKDLAEHFLYKKLSRGYKSFRCRRVYKCPKCDYWHLTSKKKKKPEWSKGWKQEKAGKEYDTAIYKKLQLPSISVTLTIRKRKNKNEFIISSSLVNKQQIVADCIDKVKRTIHQLTINKIKSIKNGLHKM